MVSLTENAALNLAWTDTRTGVKEIWYKVYDVGGDSWSLDHRMSGSFEEASLACIVSGPNSALDVLWRDLRDGNYEIYSRHSIELIATGPPEDVLTAGIRDVRCRPNPFRDQVSFCFELTSAGTARFAVFDAGGRKVRTLVDAVLPSGPCRLEWDGRSGDGRTVGAGIYFYRLDAGKMHRTGRIVRLQ